MELSLKVQHGPKSPMEAMAEVSSLEFMFTISSRHSTLGSHSQPTAGFHIKRGLSLDISFKLKPASCSVYNYVPEFLALKKGALIFAGWSCQCHQISLMTSFSIMPHKEQDNICMTYLDKQARVLHLPTQGPREGVCQTHWNSLETQQWGCSSLFRSSTLEDVLSISKSCGGLFHARFFHPRTIY